MPADPAPRQPTAVVIGRYAGAVGVLAEVLAAAGVVVEAAAGVDAVGLAAVAALVTANPDAVVVLTLSPDDPTRDLAVGRRAVAVTWHPADERPDLPGARVVPAGQIRSGLAAAVRSR